MRNVLVTLFIVMGAWFVFDGTRALITGEYTMIAGAATTGALGPWTDVVEASGLSPTGLPVRIGHLLSGVLALAAAFTIAAGWGTLAWVLGYVASAGMLWYAPFGTLIGLGAIVLLTLPSMRITIRGR